MEFVFSFSILLTFLLFVFMVLKIGKRSKLASERSLNLPPGPWKLPIIGNLHQLVGNGTLPHHSLRILANKYGPLMHLQMGEITTIVVSSPEIVKQVLRTHDLIFSSRVLTLASKLLTYDYKGVAFTPYSDQWRELRKICMMELLSTKKVDSFRSIREEEVSELINWITSKAGSVINLTDKFFSLAYGITLKAAIGSKCKDQEMFISIVDQFLKVAGGANIADLFPSIKFLQSISGIKSRLEKMHQQADTMISNVIDEHKKSMASKSEEDEDLVDVLLKVQDKGNLQFPITTDNIKAVIFEMLAAGIDSSAIALDWVFSEMKKNPRVLKKAQVVVREVLNRKGKIAEMQFLKLVIKETLRVHPAAPLLFPRECREQCKINGFDIPMKAVGFFVFPNWREEK